MYEDFYGLTGKPFQLSPDPTFYFGSKGHTSALSYLKYGVYQGEGFLVITGEVGAGTTTLVRALLEELDVRSIVAAQIVSTQLEADDLLRSVAKAFGIRVGADDKASLIAAIEAFLLMLFQQNKRALLVVDEAQNLNAGSIEELRMLSNFQCGDQALLQSFLVGQPELRNLMRSPAMEQFRQRVIASYHLGPLDESETRGYIEHRLHRVAWKGDPEFEPSAIHAVYMATGGIPRRINAMCNRLMLAGFLAGQHKFAAAEVNAVAAEITGEIGPQAVVAPLREPLTASVGSGERHPDLVGNVRRLLNIADRVERLERDVVEVTNLVRMLVEPERSLPEDEPPRQEPSKRRRKSPGTS
jgi:putative secretion ATPase (PEP-CTERM system associated)